MSSGFDLIAEQRIEQLEQALQESIEKQDQYRELVVQLRGRIRELEKQLEEKREDDGYLDDIFVDDRIPPQFHLDELERKLDYNLGQVDGFHDLSWKSKCKLAKIAVENDLSLEEAEIVLDPSISELETILKLSQRDRDSDELPDSWDTADWLEYLLGLLHEGDDARDVSC